MEDKYEHLFQKIARDVILQQAGEYPAPMYWLNRTFIGNEFKVALNKTLANVHATCTGLMLLNIDLPNSYEDAIVNT